VLSNPLATRRAATINQTVLFENPERAGPIFRIPVRVVIITPMMTTAPMGRGERIKPKIVAMKIASSCQA